MLWKYTFKIGYFLTRSKSCIQVCLGINAVEIIMICIYKFKNNHFKCMFKENFALNFNTLNGILESINIVWELYLHVDKFILLLQV